MNYAPQQIVPQQLTPEQALLYESGKKSVGLGTVLGLIIVGGGQFYAGRVGRGFAFLAAGVLFAILSFFVIGIPFAIANLVWSVVDGRNCLREENMLYLQRITSGAVYQPGYSGPVQTMPKPLAQPEAVVPAPAIAQLVAEPAAPVLNARQSSPPPSSTTGTQQASSPTRITLTEDDL